MFGKVLKMGSKRIVVGIWTCPDIVGQLDRRRGPLSRSAYLNLVLKESFEEDKSIEVLHLSKLHRRKLLANQDGSRQEP